jgi:hypothetical protein
VSDHACTWEPAAELGMARYRCAGRGRVGYRGAEGTIAAYVGRRVPTPSVQSVRIGAVGRKPSLDEYDRSPT